MASFAMNDRLVAVVVPSVTYFDPHNWAAFVQDADFGQDRWILPRVATCALTDVVVKESLAPRDRSIDRFSIDERLLVLSRRVVVRANTWAAHFFEQDSKEQRNAPAAPTNTYHPEPHTCSAAKSIGRFPMLRG